MAISYGPSNQRTAAVWVSKWVSVGMGGGDVQGPQSHLPVLTKICRLSQKPGKTFLLPGQEQGQQPPRATGATCCYRKLVAPLPQPSPPTHRQAGAAPALAPSAPGTFPRLRDKGWAARRARETRRLEESAVAWGRGCRSHLAAARESAPLPRRGAGWLGLGSPS